MTQPPDFEANDNSLVCKLNKAIYGLKQAPDQWFNKLQAILHQLRILSSACDSYIFVYRK